MFPLGNASLREPYKRVPGICFSRSFLLYWTGNDCSGLEVEKVDRFRLAICEDDRDQAQGLAALCREWFSLQGIGHQVVLFSCASALMQALEQGNDPFDLFLLDIRMEGIDGLELAHWLYGQGVRERVVFITGYAEYALAGYDAHPLHYLLKPVSRERLGEVLELAMERRPQVAVFQRSGRTLVFPLREIRYLESRNHGVMLHLRQGEQILSASLAEAERLVPADHFRRCHKSYLINLAWVERISRTEVFLRDQTRLPVSRTFYTGFQSALVQYLNRRGRG